MIANILSGLEFLKGKALVLHGDISMFNILIHRFWPKGSGRLASELREIASNRCTNTTGSNDSNDPTSPSASACNDLDIVDNTLPTVSTAPVQTSEPTPETTVPPASSTQVEESQVPSAPATTVSANYNGTLEHIEFAGMLIDFDFMRYTKDDIHMTSVRHYLNHIEHYIDTF